MSDIGTGTDPGSVGREQYTPFTEGVAPTAPAPSVETTPADEANASTLSPSETPSEGLIPEASNPTLAKSQGANVNTQATDITEHNVIAQALMTMQLSYAQTVNAMLDNWSKQIAIQAELNKKAALEKSILDGTLQSQRLRDAAVEKGVEAHQMNQEAVKNSERLQELTRPTSQEVALSTNENFIDWWNKASSREKVNYLDQHGQEMVKSYLEKTNDPILQNTDLAKAVLPLYTMVMTQTTIINPLAVDITTRPTDISSAGINLGASLTDQLQQIYTPSLLANIPQLNLLLPMMMYTSSAEAALGLYGKRREEVEEGGEKKIEDKFVDELGKRTLANTENTDSWLRYKEPSYETLTKVQQEAVVNASNLLALATVLIFDVKAQGAYSDLSPEEFDSLLKNGVPGRDVLNDIVGRINTIFSEIKDNSVQQYSEYYAFVQDFINGARLRRYDLHDLRGFGDVLAYAYSEITPSKRAPQVRGD